jgi:hypothetical protein
LTLAALLFVGCGDALVEDDYRGAPALTVRGQISQVRGEVPLVNNLRVAVFWSPTGSTTIDSSLIEQDEVSVALAFPALFEANVFAPPRGIAWRDGRPVHVGLILIYDDVNQNGRFDVPELRGGGRNLALLFAERDARASESPTGRALRRGITIGRLPLRCEPVENESVDRPTGWAAQVGEACGMPADCGAEADWLCLTEDDDIYWSGGYCTRPIDPTNPLPEADGVEPSSIWLADALTPHWMRECQRDTDCRADYVCQAETCRPDQPYTLVMLRDFQVTPLCAEEEDSDEESDEGGPG